MQGWREGSGASFRETTRSPLRGAFGLVALVVRVGHGVLTSNRQCARVRASAVRDTSLGSHPRALRGLSWSESSWPAAAAASWRAQWTTGRCDSRRGRQGARGHQSRGRQWRRPQPAAAGRLREMGSAARRHALLPVARGIGAWRSSSRPRPRCDSPAIRRRGRSTPSSSSTSTASRPAPYRGVDENRRGLS